jgi:predicted Zn-dependent protease
MKKNSILLALLLLIGCSTVPITGRKQVNVVPQGQLLPLAADSYREVIRESKLSTNRQQVDMVKRVGSNIQRAVEQYFAEKGNSSLLNGFQWEFNLIESDQVNAWCMPGGKVAFYTGIMPICLNEAGVAVVMGHEVAHAVANHGGERMSQALLANFGFSLLGSALSQNPTLTKEIFLQSIGAASQVGMLKFSRNHESEADKIGLYFTAMAGYDPREAIPFWQRMEAKSGGNAPPEFLSTHPSSSRRISDLNSWMPQALIYYEKTKKN